MRISGRWWGAKKLEDFEDPVVVDPDGLLGTDGAAGGGPPPKPTYEQHAVVLHPQTANLYANWRFLSPEYQEQYLQVEWSVKPKGWKAPPPPPPPIEIIGFG